MKKRPCDSRWNSLRIDWECTGYFRVRVTTTQYHVSIIIIGVPGKSGYCNINQYYCSAIRHFDRFGDDAAEVPSVKSSTPVQSTTLSCNCPPTPPRPCTLRCVQGGPVPRAQAPRSERYDGRPILWRETRGTHQGQR